MPIGAVWATPSLVHVVMMVSWIIIWVFAFGGRRFRGLLVLAVVLVFRFGPFGFSLASAIC
jgi:hypothetical protein